MNIAIKTHQRPEQLKAFTFAVLQRHGFTLSDVNLFVSGESQLSLYRAKLPSFAGRITMVKEPGVSAAVNAIARFYPEGEPVLHLDDDIEQIQRLESGKLVNCSDFKQTVREGFGLCQSLKCNLWGFIRLEMPSSCLMVCPLGCVSFGQAVMVLSAAVKMRHSLSAK